MCTLVVDRSPDRRCQVVVAAVRDEMLDRAADPPARHWPAYPELIGGRDRLAGGTWLAFHPTARRVACVLNGTGRPADPAGRRSRGELPLLAAGGAPLPRDLSAYDPFHLVVAEPTAVSVLTWNGHQPHRYRPGVGTHLFVNHGRWTGPADRRTARATRFGPLFAAGRPDPSPAGPAGEAWVPWHSLIDAPVGSPRDADALVARDAAGGWGTSSITLLGFGGPVTRYDFRPGPGPAPWQSIAVGGSPSPTP